MNKRTGFVVVAFLVAPIIFNAWQSADGDSQRAQAEEVAAYCWYELRWDDIASRAQARFPMQPAFEMSDELIAQRELRMSKLKAWTDPQYAALRERAEEATGYRWETIERWGRDRNWNYLRNSPCGQKANAI